MNIQHVRRISSTYRQYQGFTLIELMVTIAVLGIIASIATPSISLQLANMRVKSTAATLENALKEAKAESAIRRQNITVSHTSSTITVGNIRTYDYDTKSIIKGNNAIVFQQNKIVNNATTYTVCDSNINASSRQIEVSKLAGIVNKLGGICP